MLAAGIGCWAVTVFASALVPFTPAKTEAMLRPTSSMNAPDTSVAFDQASYEDGESFTSADVVRHPLVARIVDAYDAQKKRGATEH